MHHHTFSAIFVSLISIALCQCVVHAQPPTPTIKKIHYVGITDSLGLVLLDASELLIADTAGSRGSTHIWKIELIEGQVSNTENPDLVMPAFVSTEGEFITLPLRQPAGLALSQNGETLYICDMGDRRIFVCNAATGDLENAIDTAGQPRAFRVLGDGSIWYLTTDGRFHHRDTLTGKTTLLRDTSADDSPQPVELTLAFDFTLNESGDTIYVTQSDAGDVTAIDTETGAMKTIADHLSTPRGIEFITHDDKEYLVIAEEGANQVTVVSLSDSSVVQQIRAEDESRGFESPMMVRRANVGDGDNVKPRIFFTATDADQGSPIIVELSF